MQTFFESYKNSGDLHHAYFLVGDTKHILSNLIPFLKDKVGVSVQGSADFWHGKFHNMTVEETKSIYAMSQNKDFARGKKIFIIETDFITEEAQNTMLKFFEEPTPGTHFFIVSPQDFLLPTLQSRIIKIHTIARSSETKESILSLNLKERIDRVKVITESIKDDEGTKQDAISLLNDIEKELYTDGVEKNYDRLELCQKTRQSLYDRGAPIKIVLENLLISI
ncbi:MAG: hypothetical protein V4690_00655 [Patescibacteria group bacterium]